MERKKVLVVGASSGLGKEIALTLSKEGADLVLMSRDIDKLNNVIYECKDGNHQVYSVDVTNEQELDRALSESMKDGVPYSGFVYSAGMEATMPSKLLKKNTLEKVMEVNTYPIVMISKFFQKKGNFSPNGGSLVFISSVMGHLGQVGKTAYCMSKHAMVGVMKALALELAPKKIRVNCISPGMVKTDMSIKILESISEENVLKIQNMHPLGFGEPRDVAQAVLFLISDKSKWITGVDLAVDGGYSVQ
ncbi:SDR family NAD(P)-dependent oxidoreductase [Capnocytophaga canimorsus]|uniref:Short-chain dehydrogenase/reductase SDR n=1 Tax=Capnocytophaga canimorsus TaxID=28188 RepID=A0A0B7HL75_9FLAO|nr:SDR family oxidoreductase [Capnocytophaga canimorsus]ATA77273.1 NAD(P)-dependent oxidoreductase [Capnocytophaga canimorsus]AWL78737.1 SDR family NAD(P)-dependent oxidoreductase [Capnocytophaga canimorsus]AYW37347.1 SDR family oxidoreductase [Capnocytophaga canimorsus]MDT9500119.1 SDR family oxidoreductase [Capnocytophaga canimorsus]PJI83567.1 NAD(P)-dependent dehydrogenase (short-subunit alcohol dehydrogenase family) [Capnocytophaga canimorsus]